MLLPLLVISTFVLGNLIILIAPLGNDKWKAKFSGAIGRCWGWILVRASFLPVEVKGLEKMQDGQSYVIVANHQSCYDIFLMYGFLRRNIRWMMKASLMDVFVLGKAARVCGNISVDTSSSNKILQTYEQACTTIVDGVSLVVFPEGHRTLTGEMGSFKRGAFAIADHLQLPVLPVTILGTYEVMPKHRDFKFAHWHPLRMIVHQPINPIGQGTENINYLMNESRKTIKSAL